MSWIIQKHILQPYHPLQLWMHSFFRPHLWGVPLFPWDLRNAGYSKFLAHFAPALQKHYSLNKFLCKGGNTCAEPSREQLWSFKWAQFPQACTGTCWFAQTAVRAYRLQLFISSLWRFLLVLLLLNIFETNLCRGLSRKLPGVAQATPEIWLATPLS